jgi:aspartate kinase
MSRLVIKFGGTSVGTADAIARAAALSADLRTAGRELVVVTSAMSGVTDQLLAAAHAAAEGRVREAHATVAALRQRHLDTARTLVARLDADAVDAMEQRLAELGRLCDAVAVLGEATPRALDAVASMGERLSVVLLAAAVRERGTPAVPVDGTDVIRTDAVHQAAAPDLGETRRIAQAALRPLFDAHTIPVVTGFIGARADGVVTTLGRGGSDYSATILGAALDADEVWIYTDVDGVLTADPRVVPEARTLDVLSFREMSELAYFGAKVLHPKTILPALERGIPIRIKNTFNPDHPGTLVVSQGTEAGVLKGVTAIERQSLVTIEGRGMLGVPGIAARAFGAVARTGTSVPMISQASSEQSICFVVPQSAAPRVVGELEQVFDRELSRGDIERIWALDGVVVLTVVGSAIQRIPGVAGRVFSAVGDAGANIIAIAMGSSECSISLVVAASDAHGALRSVHRLLEA